MKKLLAIFLICLVLNARAGDKDRYFEIAKNMEIFSEVYKELNNTYVDDVDPNKLMTDGIVKMLDGLDPFTNYFTGSDLDEYQLQVTGKYAGIGSRIMKQGDYVVISEPYEGFPAQKAGLQAGDAILEIDGKSVAKYNSDEISQLLKGEPGTKISIKVKRAVTNEEKTFTFNREEIKIDNVPYFGMLNKNIGYIRLSSFTDNASTEVQNALKELKKNPEFKGLVFDLRGNGGGLLNEAINICNVFVDKGTAIVSTKGKIADANNNYTTQNKPLDLDVPLVFLTDGGTASASEIVSGSMQDLDRGIVIGQNTYGKGLVQITKPLPYKGKLKVTVSKYYIPSGRCIQRIDYSHRSDNGIASAVPDSLRKEFKTKAGRTVKDGAGIEPDIKTTLQETNPITIALYTNNHFFNYANVYKTKHTELRDGNKFRLTDDEYNDFVDYLKDKTYTYTNEAEAKLNDLQKSAEESHLSESSMKLLTALGDKIKEDKSKDLITHKSEIKELLEEEIVSRYTYEKGRIANSLKDDKDVLKAIEILSDNNTYKQILTAKK